MKSTMQTSALSNLAAFFFNPEYVEVEVRKDCRCHECRQWVEETTTFFDDEENKEVELCEECLPLYQ